jgi:hypothetical protein
MWQDWQPEIVEGVSRVMVERFAAASPSGTACASSLASLPGG